MSEQEARVELAERLEAWGRLRFYPFRHSTWAEDQQVLREAAQLLRESSPPEPSRVIPPSLDTPLVPGQVSMRDVADAPEPSDWCASDAEQCPSCMARTALKGEDDA